MLDSLSVAVGNSWRRTLKFGFLKQEAFVNRAPIPNLLTQRFQKVEWDRSPDFTSGIAGQPDGQESVDATQTLCSACVQNFFLNNLTLSVNGTADFFGRLNAGNRILVSCSGGYYAYTGKACVPTSPPDEAFLDSSLFWHH